MSTHLDGVRCMLNASSIAVIGASNKVGSFGYNVISVLKQSGYRGSILPVNPRYQEICGIDCYSDISEIRDPVDCAVLAVADGRLEAALVSAASAGSRSAVIFGMGIDECGGVNSAALTERLSAICLDSGMALCGGNCMGFINFVDNVAVGGRLYEGMPPIGHTAIVSHSGSTYSALVLNGRQLALSHIVSAGQELRTTAADYMHYFLTDDRVRAIGCVLETVRDPKRFLEVAGIADAKGVPIVVLKLGRSGGGTAMARAHSGALAGSEAAYRAVFRQNNILSVDTLDEFANTLELLSSERRPVRDEIALMTDSGGERTMIVDLADDIGLQWASITEKTTEVLKATLDPGLAPINPLDVWGTGHDHKSIATTCFRALADDPGVGRVIFAANLLTGHALLTDWSQVVETIFNGTSKPVVVISNLSSAIDRDEGARLRKLGIPVLLGTKPALRSILLQTEWHRYRISQEPSSDQGTARLPIIEHWLPRLSGRASLTTLESLELAQEFGIQLPRSVTVASEEEARLACKELDFPMVLKTLASGVDHKYDAKGVVLGIRSEEQLLAAWLDMSGRLGKPAMVQEMATEGVEFHFGLTIDPQWGPLVTIGFGGIFVEILNDTVSFIPPIDAHTAARLLSRLRGYRLLTGARGRRPIAIAALCEAIVNFGCLALTMKSAISEMDINPVIATAERAVAVDALVVPAPN